MSIDSPSQNHHQGPCRDITATFRGETSRTMKLKLELTIMPNGDQAIKGEELREEITSQCEQFQIDGWEVEAVKLNETKERNIGQDIYRMAEALHRIAFSPPEQPWADNPEYTNRQMAEFWIAEIAKMTKAKA